MCYSHISSGLACCIPELRIGEVCVWGGGGFIHSNEQISLAHINSCTERAMLRMHLNLRFI